MQWVNACNLIMNSNSEEPWNNDVYVILISKQYEWNELNKNFLTMDPILTRNKIYDFFFQLELWH